MERPFKDDLDECDRRFGVVTARTIIAPKLKRMPKISVPKVVLPKKIEKPIPTIRAHFRITLRSPFRSPTADLILPAVYKAFGVPESDLRSHCRRRDIAWPRMAAYLMFSEVMQWSLTRVGAYFKRDHTTILYGLRKARELIASDEWFRARVEAVRAELG